MTRTTNARIAGVTFLVYFAVVMASVAVVKDEHVRVLLTLIGQFSALVLGVTLYSVTRDQGPEFALIGLTCRIVEGVLGATLLPLSLAVNSLGPSSAAPALAEFLASARTWNTVVSALFFAVGSTAFAWLMLRGRMIPTGLAWLGVLASALMVISLPLKLAGIVGGRVMEVTSIPIVFFELPLGVWLIAKGIAPLSVNADSRLRPPA